MRKMLLIGAALVALFFGAQMLTKNETTMGKNIPALTESAPSQAVHQGGYFPSSSPASTKELTKVQKKLEELGFYPDRFQSIQIKNKSTNK